MTYSLKLFCAASIEGPAGPLIGRAAQRHRLALLAILATTPRGGVTRDKLIAYLWPESDTERARRSLSDSVYRINKAMGDDTVLAEGDNLRLNSVRLPSDLVAFREALEREEWAAAIERYAGPLLDGFHLPDAVEFERWLDGERDHLARQYAGALESLAEQQATSGELAAAVATWRRRAAHDPYDCRIAFRLMEALEAAGNPAGAIQHARIHAQLLEDEFGTGPDPGVAALAERLSAEPASVMSAAAAEDRLESNLEDSPAPAAEPREMSRDDPERPAVAPLPTASPAAPTASPASPAAPPAAPAASRPAADPPADRGNRVPRLAALIIVPLLVLAAVWLAWESQQDGQAASASVPGIVVLPFDNRSPAEQHPFFADGVTEDILTNLSRVADLRVIARASAWPYRDSDKSIREIASELAVRYILEGSVRRSGEEVRITAQLIDARTNANIWGQNYDRRLEDVFAVQSDIARRVAEALEAELNPAVAEQIGRAPTQDLVAYNDYLRGRYFWHRRTEADLKESARFFGQAVQRDSSYARAWAGLADAYSVLAFYDYLPPEEAYPKAKQAALRALEINETLAEAHASLGYITLYYDWDAALAESEFRRTIELNPNYSVGHQWYANHLVATARFDEAAREMSRAREVNPLSLIANGALGWVYYYAGRYEDAVRQCDLALEMDPDWDLGYLWRGLALEELGRTQEAIDSFRRAVELSGGSGITTAALARVYATTGSADQAWDLLSGLIEANEEGRYQPSFEIAKVYVALGGEDEALRWLERAYEERSHSMVFLEEDPQLAPLRPNPRFGRLVERVGLED